MANPPEAVKLAMESACTILGHKIDSWRTVQGIIRRDDFILYPANRQLRYQPNDQTYMGNHEEGLLELAIV